MVTHATPMSYSVRLLLLFLLLISPDFAFDLRPLSCRQRFVGALLPFGCVPSGRPCVVSSPCVEVLLFILFWELFTVELFYCGRVFRTWPVYFFTSPNSPSIPICSQTPFASPRLLPSVERQLNPTKVSPLFHFLRNSGTCIW